MKTYLVGANYRDTGGVPKDHDLFYRCTICGGMISSVPRGSVGCDCGNVFIDKVCLRLVVADFGDFEVVRKCDSERGRGKAGEPFDGV